MIKGLKMTETDNVFFPETPELVQIKEADLEKIISAAQNSSLRRARFCLHASHEDKVQQMVLAFCHDTRIPIHRHLNKSESFHIIQGQLEVMLYNGKGEIINTIKMGPFQSGLTFVYRINTDVWHTVRPLTDMVIIHEIVAGPFNEKMDILNL